MEMISLQLELVDVDMQRVSGGYPLGGVIYFTVGDACFPEENWYDLVSIDFENWLPKITSFAFDHTDICELGFMDGPARVRFERLSTGMVTATCVWNKQHEIPAIEIDFPEFLKSVCKCIRKYNRLLHEKGIDGQFTDEIARLMKAYV